MLFILKSNLNIAPELIEKKLGLSVFTLDFISVLHKFLDRGLGWEDVSNVSPQPIVTTGMVVLSSICKENDRTME